MASIKWNGRWVESTSLPLEIKIEYGLNEEVKKELESIPTEVKKSPVKKRNYEDD